MHIMKETDRLLLTLSLNALSTQVSLNPFFFQYTLTPVAGQYVVTAVLVGGECSGHTVVLTIIVTRGY
jgi:hypothetical protein